MAPKTTKIEQTAPLHDPRFDSLRRELEEKIYSKVPIWVFTLIIGGMFAVGASTIGYLIFQNSKISDEMSTKNIRVNDKIDNIEKRLLVIETVRKLK